MKNNDCENEIIIDKINKEPCSQNSQLFKNNCYHISFKYIILFNILFCFFTTSYFIKSYNKKIRKCKIDLEYQINAYNNIYNTILRNIKNNSIVDSPSIPEIDEEINGKKYFKSYYNNSNIRYHFEDLFLNRKIFQINYSYLPYENIDKSKSYDYNANYIYESTGMLNITKLDQAFYNKENTNTLSLNHIHLSMGHDVNYILLSLISISSILNTMNNNTFIHFHFVLLGCKFEDMKQIIALKKINYNVEFIFYNGKQAELDFSMYSKKEVRGLGEYTRFLIPEIVNNTNRIIILDSGDIIAKKDLSEIYFFDIQDNYFGFALDPLAGKNYNFFVFAKNKFYPNTGVCLVNVKRFRKDNLYMAGYFVRLAYDHLPCPFQEMFFLVSQYKFKFFPLIYNYPQFFNSEKDFYNKKYNTSIINFYLENQKHSPFRYTLEEIFEAEANQVIDHLFLAKPFSNKANKENGKIWINYAKLANISEKLRLKYPKTFAIYDV